MSTTIIFLLGTLSGSIVTFIFIGILVRNGSVTKFSKIADYNERSLEALQERNRISQRQLDLYLPGQALAGWAAGRNNGGDFNEPDSSKTKFVAASCHLYAEAIRKGGQGV